MFASPKIIQRHNSDEFIEIDQLDCAGEWAKLWKGLNMHNTNIKTRKICGTMNNLQQILNEGTLVLHFSGHGQLEDDMRMLEFKQLRNKGDVLIMEKEDGTQ